VDWLTGTIQIYRRAEAALVLVATLSGEDLPDLTAAARIRLSAAQALGLDRLD